MCSKSTFRYFIGFFSILALLFAGFYFYKSSNQSEFDKISDILEASHAHYIFLQDASQKQWIYKQITEPSPEDQIDIVLETFASDICSAIDFPINYVKMISNQDTFAHRIFQNYPGSLHLKVAGQSIEEKTPWDDFDLHQKFRTPFMIASKGPLKPAQTGLRREVIATMAKHSDLIKLVALDTYLGNIDRSNPNVFYDAQKDRFYGIDMGNCLMGNLAYCAKERLEVFFQEPEFFSKAELTALEDYRNALILLSSRFPPNEMQAILQKNLLKGGFNENSPLLWNEDVERKVNKWTKFLEKNYEDTLVLIDYLEDIKEIMNK